MSDEPIFRTCKKHGPLPFDRWKEKKLENGKYTSYICKRCRNDAVSKSKKKNRNSYLAKRRISETKRRRAKGVLPFKSSSKERKRELKKAAYLRLKMKVFSHYSSEKPSCACCGNDTFIFLVLDHKDGGGNQHRKTISGNGAGSHTYQWVVRNNYPPMFRVLCHNCNHAYAHYKKCPHQENKEINTETQ
jgi:hypothetical protein